MIELLAEVLTIPAVVASIAAGFATGYLVVADIIRNPRYGTAIANPTLFGRLIATIGIGYGAIFYFGQIVVAYVGGDTEWPRAAARFSLWIVFAIASGAGVWVGLHRAWRIR